MNFDEFYNLVINYYGKKARSPYCDEEKKEVTCTIYESFIFSCSIGSGKFEGGIKLGCDGYITTFLGKKLSLNSDEKSVREGLKIVEDYCRLRLPDKFLKAYDEAYNSFL